jgi:hypothetical protein
LPVPHDGSYGAVRLGCEVASDLSIEERPQAHVMGLCVIVKVGSMRSLTARSNASGRGCAEQGGEEGLPHLAGETSASTVALVRVASGATAVASAAAVAVAMATCART